MQGQSCSDLSRNEASPLSVEDRTSASPRNGQDIHRPSSPAHLRRTAGATQSNKMSDQDCERDLVLCKDRASPAALLALDQIRKRSHVLQLEDEVKLVQDMLKQAQAPFRHHAEVERFQKQFDMSTCG